MTTATNPHSVDSTTRPCCRGVGAHAPNCVAKRPDVPLPAGAQYATDWEAGKPQAFRVLYGPARTVGDDDNACVSTDAVQFADGSIDRDGWVWSPGMVIAHEDTDTGIRLNSTEARALAAVLLEAADQLDGWVQK